MKNMGLKKRTSIALIIVLLLSMMATPMAQAVKKEDGITFLESKDLKTITVNKKKAFNFSIQDFSNSYDSIVKQMVKSKEDELYLLRNLNEMGSESDEGHKYGKIDIDGSMIVLSSPQKNGKKGKVNRLYINVCDYRDGEYMETILTVALSILTEFDEDALGTIMEKIGTAIEKGKVNKNANIEGSFTHNNMKFTVSAPTDLSFSYLLIEIVPK